MYSDNERSVITKGDRASGSNSANMRPIETYELYSKINMHPADGRQHQPNRPPALNPKDIEAGIERVIIRTQTQRKSQKFQEENDSAAHSSKDKIGCRQSRSERVSEDTAAEQ